MRLNSSNAACIGSELWTCVFAVGDERVCGVSGGVRPGAVHVQFARTTALPAHRQLVLRIGALPGRLRRLRRPHVPLHRHRHAHRCRQVLLLIFIILLLLFLFLFLFLLLLFFLLPLFFLPFFLLLFFFFFFSFFSFLLYTGGQQGP